MNVGEVCSREVYIVTKTETLAQAVWEMKQHHVGAIIVVEPRGEAMRPIGVVTDRDVIFATRAEEVDLSAPVSHVMTTCPLTLAEDGGIFEVDASRTAGRLSGEQPGDSPGELRDAQPELVSLRQR